MTITIDSRLDERLQERATALGMSASGYVERLLAADQDAEAELEALALEGLESGDAEDVGPAYWAELHRSLNAKFVGTGEK